jgi:hypothetical protein
MKKIFNQTNFSIRQILIILLGHLWRVEVTHINIFAFKFTLRYLHPDIIPIVCHRKFAAGVVDTGGNLPPGSLTPAANLPPVSLTPVANLPPVSTTLVKLVVKVAAGVVDTGGKFATGVVDTGGQL